MCNHSYSVFSLTWPASIQIYWNKRERLHKNEFNSHRTGLGHKHGRRFIVLGHKYGRHEVKWKHTIGAIHKVPTKVRDAEETLIYDNLLNQKNYKAAHMLYAYSLKQHTFKAISKWRFKQIRLSACLVLMVERIRWKPSSYVSYKDPTLETLSLSILQHLCLWECKARISQSIGIFATF